MDYGHALEFGAFITPTSRVPHDAVEGSQIVDEAGRDPREIRRHLNILPADGPGQDWTEQLAGLTLEEDASVFLLVSDDTDAMRRFATETAPAVRELVTQQRGVLA